MGPEELPSREQLTMTDTELQSFLQQHHLSPSGDPTTLKDRAARLKIAVESPGFLWEGLTGEQKRRILQELLLVADVFCVRKEDLKTPAAAAPMGIATGTNAPIKRKPYKVPAKETEVLNEAVMD